VTTLVFSSQAVIASAQNRAAVIIKRFMRNPLKIEKLKHGCLKDVRRQTAVTCNILVTSVA
jgi:hypothetical protein